MLLNMGSAKNLKNDLFTKYDNEVIDRVKLMSQLQNWMQFAAKHLGADKPEIRPAKRDVLELFRLFDNDGELELTRENFESDIKNAQLLDSLYNIFFPVIRVDEFKPLKGKSDPKL